MGFKSVIGFTISMAFILFGGICFKMPGRFDVSIGNITISTRNIGILSVIVGILFFL
jgi:hypothetical protein